MDIEFVSSKLMRIFSEEKLLVRTYGAERSKKIIARMTSLSTAATLDDMRNIPGHRHELTGNLAGKFALDLDGPYRLIFEPANAPLPIREDGGLDWKLVTSVRIREVKDYHG